MTPKRYKSTKTHDQIGPLWYLFGINSLILLACTVHVWRAPTSKKHSAHSYRPSSVACWPHLMLHSTGVIRMNSDDDNNNFFHTAARRWISVTFDKMRTKFKIVCSLLRSFVVPSSPLQSFVMLLCGPLRYLVIP